MNESMVETLTYCRICGKMLSLVEKFTNMPLDGITLLNKPSIPKRADVNFYRCSACGHYQIPLDPTLDPTLEYTSLNMKTLMENRKKSIEYLSGIAPGSNRILEIGCGNGVMFETVGAYFGEIVGVDPAKNVIETTENNHLVINDYFHAGLPLGGLFDAFYALQTLEHIDNPMQIMKDVYVALKEGGVGWIEVPNGLTIINEAQYYSIFSVHLNYYTPHSLSTLAYLSGFETLYVHPSLGKDHLEIFVRKPKPVSLAGRKNKQCENILAESLKYSHIVIWGAGGKSHALLGYLYDKLRIAHIVDIDTNKQGLYLPGASVRVEAPSKKLFENTDLVIIFSVPYEKEIINILHNEFFYDGQILCLSDIF
jgi:SAM-dependent methyltransferase